MMWIKRFFCWIKGHKTKPIQRMWDMVGDPKVDYWYEYDCNKCGKVKDF